MQLSSTTIERALRAAGTTSGTRVGPAWRTFLDEAQYVRGRTFSDVLGEQVRFRVVRPGATSIDQVRPDSAGAIELWDQPQTRQFVQGVLDVANQVSPGPTPLRGFTLSTSHDGYVANRAVHHFRRGAASDAAYEAGIEAARTHVERTAAVRKGTWLHLGPKRSAGILQQLRVAEGAELPRGAIAGAGRGVKTLLHELNHVGSPIPGGKGRQWAWMSEGTAETLARWPGRVSAAGEQLGLRVPRNVGAHFDRIRSPYQAQVDSVRGLLELSGIDPGDAAQFHRAEQLLNFHPEGTLLNPELATRIAERFATGEQARRAAEELVTGALGRISTTGRDADPTVVAELGRQLVAIRDAGAAARLIG